MFSKHSDSKSLILDNNAYADRPTFKVFYNNQHSFYSSLHSCIDLNDTFSKRLIFNGNGFDSVFPYFYIRMFLFYLCSCNELKEKLADENVKQLFLNYFQKNRIFIWLFQEIYIYYFGKSENFVSFFYDEKFYASKDVCKEILDLFNFLPVSHKVDLIFYNYDRISNFSKRFFEKLVNDFPVFRFFSTAEKKIESFYVSIQHIDVQDSPLDNCDFDIKKRYAFLQDDHIHLLNQNSLGFHLFEGSHLFKEDFFHNYFESDFVLKQSIIYYFFESIFKNESYSYILKLFLVFLEPFPLKYLDYFIEDFGIKFYSHFLELIDKKIITVYGDLDDLNSLCFFSNVDILYAFKQFNLNQSVSETDILSPFLSQLLSKNHRGDVQLSYFLFRSLVKVSINLSEMQFVNLISYLDFLLLICFFSFHKDYLIFVNFLETQLNQHKQLDSQLKLDVIDFVFQFFMNNGYDELAQKYLEERQLSSSKSELITFYFQIKLLHIQNSHEDVVDLCLMHLKQFNITLFKSYFFALFNVLFLFLKVKVLNKNDQIVLESILDKHLIYINKILILLSLSLIWEEYNAYKKTSQLNFFQKFFLNQNNSFLLSQSTLQILSNSLKHGFGEGSVFGYSVFWINYCSTYKFEKAFQLGRKLFSIASSQTSEIANLNVLLYYFFLSPIRFSFDYSIIQMTDIRYLSKKSGRNFINGISIVFLIFLKVNLGTNFKTILNDFSDFEEDSNNAAYYRDVSLICLNLVRNSMQKNYSILQYEYLHPDKNKNFVLGLPILIESLLLFINQQYSVILDAESKLILIFTPNFNLHFHLLIIFLIVNSKILLSKSLLKIKKYLKIIDKFKALHDLNYHARYFITQGNLAAHKECYEQSLVFFDKAISLASKANNQLDLAMASEFRARVLSKLNLSEYMRFDFYRALTCYENIGLIWKSESIKKKENVMLLNFLYDIKSFELNKLLTDTLSKIYLDFSAQKELPELVKSLLLFCSDFTGNCDFSLFFVNNQNLTLYATILSGKVNLLNFQKEFDLNLNFPIDFLLSFALNGDRIMIKDPSQHSELKDDLYIKTNKPDFISIFPLKTKDKFIGFLYSESSTFEFFSSTQLEFLNNFISLVSVAIENVMLFEQNQSLISNLEERVVEQVSQIKIAEEEKRKSLEIAQKASAQSAYAVLTRGIAHEIRNPMAMILSGTELTLDYLDDKEKVKKYLTSVKDSVLRLKSISTNMLRYGNPVSNSKSFVDIISLLTVVKDVSQPECKKRFITVSLDTTRTRLVYIDENSIYQVFINLILNAIQAIEKKGSIEISVREQSYYDKDHISRDGICIFVKDSGCGMSREKIKQIFDPFYSSKYGNVGLGLSIVFNTISLHFGKIDVVSEEGKGSTFFVYLPCEKVELGFQKEKVNF